MVQVRCSGHKYPSYFRSTASKIIPYINARNIYVRATSYLFSVSFSGYQDAIPVLPVVKLRFSHFANGTDIFTSYTTVRAFAHGAMGRRIDPSWCGPIELFLVPASAPRLV